MKPPPPTERHCDTVGLERYKAAMLATAKALYAPEPAPIVELRLPERIEPTTRRVMLAEIRAEVARHFQIPESEMRSSSHKRESAWPRQIAMYLAKHIARKSRGEIGRYFGNRDSSTVTWACRAVDRRREGDPRLDRVIRMLSSRLGGGQ